jgi:hypothetical protein
LDLRDSTSGISTREILKEKARRGEPGAMERLRGPSFHEGLEYLLAIFNRLASMREYDMNGPRRLSPALIRDGVELFGYQSITPFEAEAIVRMDTATLTASVPDSPPSAQSEAAPVDRIAAWPTKKAADV